MSQSSACWYMPKENQVGEKLTHPINSGLKDVNAHNLKLLKQMKKHSLSWTLPINCIYSKLTITDTWQDNLRTRETETK